MQNQSNPRYTAFAGDRKVAQGTLALLAQALASVGPSDGAVLVFDDATGAPVDAPLQPEQLALLAKAGSADSSGAEPSRWSETDSPIGGDAVVEAGGVSRPSPGRPRLGVVAREVTLLPRHWAWLSTQPGGASAALRRLVDQARKLNEKADCRRQSGERSYKFMSAIAGHRAEFEEAARALFAGDSMAFATRIAHWPADVRAHLAELAQGAFEPPADDEGTP